MVKKYIVVLPLAVIAILATIFQYPVHIINALTLESVPGYGVQISIVRVIFEPVLGVLLYLNRSLYPLQELPIALGWIVTFYVLYGLYKVRSTISDGQRSRRVLLFLGNLPLLIGICFAIFVVILFLPLPNNTIVNNTDNEVLVTTHAHTEFSHDGLMSQEKMWQWHRRNGFDAFFITDHANYAKTLEFSQRQRRRELPPEPLILVGQEHSGSNHMSLLGLKGTFETKGKPDSVIVNLVHKYGGAVLVNHWFDGKGKAKEFYKDLGVDGFEIENVGKELYYDRELFRELKEYCEDHNLLMVGGLDFHGYGRACAIWNAFTIPNWDKMDLVSRENAILEVLRARDQDKVKVLMYNDRPYYDSSNLVFSPFITLINYFRTLNLYQVLSWFFWLILVQLLWNFRRRYFVPMRKKIAIAGLLSALFLVALGFYYWVRANAVKGYSDLFLEYSSLLLIIGSVFMGYSLFVMYIRFFRKVKK
ncbi:PHP domain-containing protein [Arenibacter aquaticus]|uniref:PHP domain-containing protein n=1 Tax=Arenibacter aquaticus TaxID=2489054 RepID=A0A3S0BVQ2_9FLAO|nr:PHP domain-containing protein [Arenibacter aquaticus]RTE52693.1 PHP domain-containing protein [Arenibacter aquaticus]